MSNTPWNQRPQTGAYPPGAGPYPPQTGAYPQQTGPCPPQPPHGSTGEYRGPGTSGQPFDPAYPFEEPEQAPELAQERSENLYRRSEPFWDTMHGTGSQIPTPRKDPNYWNHPETLRQDTMPEIRGEAPSPGGERQGAGVLKKTLVILAVVLVVGVVLYSALFRIRSITVTGNVTISPEEIISLSGLRVGMNAMSVDEELVMERIGRHRYLRCTLVDVQLDRIVIHVAERVPAAYVNYNGMQIILDNRGWVLEESHDIDQRHEQLIQVSGMQIRTCIPGQQLILHYPAQLDVFNEILVELKAMQSLWLVKELDLSSMDSIYLATSDGYVIRMGDSGRVHEKLRAMLVVRERVLQDVDVYGYGTIDVTDPTSPTFAPEKKQN